MRVKTYLEQGIQVIDMEVCDSQQREKGGRRRGARREIVTAVKDHTRTDRQADGQTDRHRNTHKHTDRYRHTHTHTHTHKHTHTHTHLAVPACVQGDANRSIARRAPHALKKATVRGLSTLSRKLVPGTVKGSRR